MGPVLALSWWDRNAGAITFASLLVALVAILVAVLIFFYQRDKKTFDWAVVDDSPLAPPSNPFPDLTVAWKGEALTRPRLVTIRLENTGKREIRSGDFDGDGIVVSVTGAALVSAGFVRQSLPVNVDKAFLIQTEHTCTVKPALFNRRDFLELQLLCDEELPGAINVEVQIRIAGETRKSRRLGGPRDAPPGALQMIGRATAEAVAATLGAVWRPTR